MKKIILGIGVLMVMICLTGCDLDTVTDTDRDIQNTQNIGDKLSNNQSTPTDIDYSLERYNLIKRAYWVNGMREKAMALPNPIANMPLGYIVLLTNSGSVVGRFTVDGKITSLNSFLTPNMKQEYRTGSSGAVIETELPDIDGSYGENDGGIFFFTNDGKYVEWNGEYLYSDIPFIVNDPIVKVGQ